MTDHLTRWASVTFLLAALFCVVSGLIASPAGRGANIEQHPPGDSARALEALTVAQSQGGASWQNTCGVGDCQAARDVSRHTTTAACGEEPRGHRGQGHSVVHAYTPRNTAPARNLLERETHRRETDPFRRCATKALAGSYGELAPWQRCGYEWGLARGVEVCGVAKTTFYGYLWESAAMAGGKTCASGATVYVGECAANPEIPLGTIIWTAAHGIARVEDRGGWVKVGYAWVHGKRKRVTNSRETANFDFYSETPGPTRRNVPWARVKR